ncbi:MAG: helix-turn-helix domain-containing protein [Planctomycetaceae bacterium]|nr:helix-turn-helix domain-containing protein [Planctomycetaceae bacterium]
MQSTKANQVDSERYLTPPKCAKILGVDDWKVLGWINSGELPAVDLSGGSSRPRWKIKPSDFEAFLATKSNRAKS